MFTPTCRTGLKFALRISLGALALVLAVAAHAASVVINSQHAETDSIVGMPMQSGPNGSVGTDLRTEGCGFQGDSSGINGVADLVFTLTPVPVPLPAAAWLMISGLGGLAAFVRRRRSGVDLPPGDMAID